MAEQFDEAWEFYVADPEIGDLFVEQELKFQRIAKSDKKKFMFRFEGNSDLTIGSFFDGISFGKTPSAKPIFAWGKQSPYRDAELVKIFEAQLDSIEPEKRRAWLTDRAMQAWLALDDRSRQIMIAMVAIEPPPVREGQIGRRPGVVPIVSAQFDVSEHTIYRVCLRSRLFMMRDMLDPDLIPKCACGCGRAVSIAYVNNKKYGHVAGEPVRYIVGHNPTGKVMPRVVGKIRVSCVDAQLAIAALEFYRDLHDDDGDIVNRCEAVVEMLQDSIDRINNQTSLFS